MIIKDMQINNNRIEEAKLNSQIVYRKNKYLTLENIIYNADFKFGTDGFNRFGNATIQEVSDGWLTWIKQTLANSNTYILSTLKKELIAGNVYYGSCEFNAIEESKYFFGELQLNSPNIAYNSKSMEATESDIAKVSGIFHVTEQYRLFLNITSDTENLKTIFRLRNPMLVDVTELAKTMGDIDIENMIDKIGFFADRIEYKK